MYHDMSYVYIQVYVISVKTSVCVRVRVASHILWNWQVPIFRQSQVKTHTASDCRRVTLVVGEYLVIPVPVIPDIFAGLKDVTT